MKKETKDKLEYFKDYYLGKTVIGLVLVSLAVFLIVHFVNRKESVSGVCPISPDPVNSVAVGSSYFDGFLEQNGYDPRKNTFYVVTDVYLSSELNDDVARTNANMLQNIMMTKSADIYLAEEEIYSILAASGYMADIRSIIDEETFRELDEEERIFYFDNVPAGVRVDPENPFISATGWYSEPVVIGVIEAPKSEDLSYAFLDLVLSRE
ncbi:MAG: hypothetical protein K6F79_01555 [Saccharofermentans sp.]|nr:hypothetical protein [Saccharofermentans sp.]